jgi:SAM-dependent methyltransferase
MIAGTTQSVSAGLAFDQLAPRYDSIFTVSSVGKTQRDVVWQRSLKTFVAGSHILELNCGTGEDALFLAKAGIRVTACDVSARMVAEAHDKIADASLSAEVDLHVLATEDIEQLKPSGPFDGVLSNFSGLNCVRDLRRTAQLLAELLRPGAPLLLCFSTRYCFWELSYYLLQNDSEKAFRRCRGLAQARVGNVEFPVFYPTLTALRKTFAPEFNLISVTGVGIAVPPSYMEVWIAQHPRLLNSFKKLDSVVCRWPLIRTFGDHMLLHMEKV